MIITNIVFVLFGLCFYLKKQTIKLYQLSLWLDYTDFSLKEWRQDENDGEKYEGGGGIGVALGGTGTS